MERVIKLNETEVKSEISTDESIGSGENNPFMRLASTPTINCLLRKKATYPNHSRVVDSLDLSLTSVYNHHTQWWASRSAVVMQSPQFRCRPIKMLQAELEKADSENLTIYKERYRNHPNHVAISLTSNHLSTTHRGFGRSIDGVFFTS